MNTSSISPTTPVIEQFNKLRSARPLARTQAAIVKSHAAEIIYLLAECGAKLEDVAAAIAATGEPVKIHGFRKEVTTYIGTIREIRKGGRQFESASDQPQSAATAAASSPALAQKSNEAPHTQSPINNACPADDPFDLEDIDFAVPRSRQASNTSN